MENEADQEANNAWTKSGKNFDPDIHDEGIMADDANDTGIWRYHLLSELRNSVRLTLTASMYFEMDKELRSWLARELRNLTPGLQRSISQSGHKGPQKVPYPKAAEQVQKKPIHEVWSLLKCLGLNVQAQPYFQELEKCRLVVNIYKHGAGSSLDDLKKNYANFYKRTCVSSISSTDLTQLMQIKDSDLDGFANAITLFWESVPNGVELSKVTNFPKWVTDKPKNKSGLP